MPTWGSLANVTRLGVGGDGWEWGAETYTPTPAAQAKGSRRDDLASQGSWRRCDKIGADRSRSVVAHSGGEALARKGERLKDPTTGGFLEQA